MDHIDHALGRPLDPTDESHRNYFATSGASADEMATSPFWQEGKRCPGDTMRFFHVTNAGREALAAHLREIGDQHRAFTVTYRDYSATVVATTRDKARYDYFLHISDCRPDLTYGEFMRDARVHVRAPKRRAAPSCSDISIAF